MGALLEVRGLSVELPTPAGWVRPVSEVSLRIGIARALILHPRLVVADEPLSALDVSVGAQVLLLLPELQPELALTYLFISHSLPVVAQVATRIAVMRAGQFLEVGTAEQVLSKPKNAYTRELLAVVPELPRA